MVQFNGHILDLSIQHHGRIIISPQKELINNKAKKGYLTRSATTRSLQKELRNLINNRDTRKIKNCNLEDKILSIITSFKNRRLHILQDPTNSVPWNAKKQRGTRTRLGSGTTTCSKLLLRRTNRPRLHFFLQRTDAVHPRWKSTARRDNIDQGKSAGICLPKPDVMQDQVLICTGQSQGGQGRSTQNCWMKECIPHHKTSSNYHHVLPSTMLLWD